MLYGWVDSCIADVICCMDGSIYMLIFMDSNLSMV